MQNHTCYNCKSSYQTRMLSHFVGDELAPTQVVYPEKHCPNCGQRVTYRHRGRRATEPKSRLRETIDSRRYEP